MYSKHALIYAYVPGTYVYKKDLYIEDGNGEREIERERKRETERS